MGKRSFFAGLFMCLYFGVVAPSAQAAVFTFGDNLPDNILLNHGNVVSGSFDLQSFLSGQSDYAQPYTVNSATAVFNFYDNQDFYYTHHYSQNGNIFSPYSYYEDYTSEEGEGATVDLDGLTSTAYTPYHSVNHSYSQGTCYFLGFIPYTCYSHYAWGHSGGYGDASLTLDLDADRLMSLSNEGVVDFNITGVGSIYFKDAYLSLDISPNGSMGSAVPEPITVVLFGSGLAGLFFRRQIVG